MLVRLPQWVEVLSLLQAAYPLLKAAGSARMILISSVAGGPTALRSGTIYAMTKGTFCRQITSWHIMFFTYWFHGESEASVVVGAACESNTVAHVVCSCHEPADKESML